MSGVPGPVIEIEGLRKVYRGRRGARMALDGLDLMVEAGQVHGFLGPNGSGKTTTLRALLGLVRADAGVTRLFGRDVPKALPQVMPAVGAIVESPQFFGNFTARRTLRLLATVGGIRHNRVDAVLELVGLRDRAKERVRSYSLGMKQRLAVATALLKSPSLLILDEPANGLDPAGIREMRDLLRSLADQGVTVLLSSHILAEVQQVCDHVTIISRGRRVMSGPVVEVLSRFDKGDVQVRVTDLDKAAQLIADAGLPVRVLGDHMVVSDLADPAWITEALAKRRMYVSELTPLLPNLENVFLDLTGTAPTPDGHRQVDDAYRPPNDAALDILDPEPRPEVLVAPVDRPTAGDPEAAPATTAATTDSPTTTDSPGATDDNTSTEDGPASQQDPAVPAQPTGPDAEPEASRTTDDKEVSR
jgi:ABC-2 type transport system ATP-binding protein